MPKPVISQQVILGDSLSDSGQLKNSKPLLARATDLSESPTGRFTNEYTWADYLAQSAALNILREQFIAAFVDAIKPDMLEDAATDIAQFEAYVRGIELEKFHPDTFNYEILKDNYNSLYNNDNIFNALDLTRFNVKHIKENMANFFYGSFSLGDYERVLFQGHNFVRRFAEGGLSARHYYPIPTFETMSLIWHQLKYNLGEMPSGIKYAACFVAGFIVLLGKILGSRAMLSSLDSKANALLKDDQAQQITSDDKETTLVTEWTGANDFITMNACADEGVCDSAIQARIDNIIKLQQAGYKHFLLMELPDLSLTPRYQNRSPEEKAEVSRLISYFNSELRTRTDRLVQDHSELDIKIFRLEEKFNDIYNNPEKYGLSENIDKYTPYIKVDEDVVNQDGNMFWDDVHPSNLMHHVLSQEIAKFCRETYDLTAPAEVTQPCCPVAIAKALLTTFEAKYNRAYADYRHSVKGITTFFGMGVHRQTFDSINRDPSCIEEAKQSLSALYSLSATDKIVKKAMVDLGWLQQDGKIPTDNIAPILTQSYNRAMIKTEALAALNDNGFGIELIPFS